MAERITYVTNDGVTIVGNWVTSPTTIGAAILLHQYPSTRQSWGDIQRILATRGIASLAIDLRGHGESIKGPDGIQLDYQVFKNEEHASSIHDVRGAYEWIQTRGIERDRIVAVGASIGANLALNFLSEEPHMPAAAAISPGEEYHGVNTFENAEYISPHQSVWIVSSSDDEKSYIASEQLDKMIVSEQKVFERLKEAGHGMDVFTKNPKLMEQMADWLRDRILNFT